MKGWGALGKFENKEVVLPNTYRYLVTFLNYDDPSLLTSDMKCIAAM